MALSSEVILETLLEVQAADLVADQLRHRRESIPDRALRADQLRALAALDEEGRTTAVRFHDLDRSQRRQEDEIAAVTAKITDIDRSLYSGTVSSPRDLQAMQAEIEALTRRRALMEEKLIEVMEEAEPLGVALAGIEEATAVHQAEAERLGFLIAEAEKAIDGELAEVTAGRDALAAGVPRDLLVTYERLRARLGGVAITRLEAGRCLGCHLALPSGELDAIRHAPPGASLFHEECGRLLVR